MVKEKSPVKGRTQKAVVKLFQGEGKSLTAQEVGDKLYATTSSCAQYGDGTGSMGGSGSPEQRRKAWAQKVLVALRRNNFIKQNPADKKKFMLTEGGKNAIL